MSFVTDLLYNLCSSKSRTRGYEYYRAGYVHNLRLDGDKISAFVEIRDLHKVQAEFNSFLRVTHFECTCDYNGSGGCSHFAAVMYELNSHGFFTTDYYRNAITDATENGNDNREVPKEDESTVPEPHEYVQQRKEAEKNAADTLEQYKKQQELLLFRNRMSKMLPQSPKVSKQKYTREYSIALEITRNQRKLIPVIVHRNQNGTVSSVREMNVNNPEYSLEAPPEILNAAFFSAQTQINGLRLPQETQFEYTEPDLLLSSLYGRMLSLFTGQHIYFLEERSSLDKAGNKLFVSPEPASAHIVLSRHRSTITAKLEIQHPQLGNVSVRNSSPVLTAPLWILSDNTLFRLNNFSYRQYSVFHASEGEVSITGPNALIFEREFVPRLLMEVPVVSDTYEFEEVAYSPVRRIYLKEKGDALSAELRFGYGPFEVAVEGGDFISEMKDGKIYKSARDRDFENTTIDFLTSVKLRKQKDGIFFPSGDPVSFLIETLPLLGDAGFEVFGEQDLTSFNVFRGMPRLMLNVSSEIQWFEIEARVYFGDEEMNLAELLLHKKNKKKFVRLKSGKILRLAGEWMERLDYMTAFAETEKGKFKFSKALAHAVEEMIEIAEETETDEMFNAYIARLKNFREIRKTEVPENLNATLRSYQQHSLDWFDFLREFQLGGILADDMGLGKTIQVLAMLLAEKNGGNRTPSLVVAPTSVIFNWIKEAEKFTPTLKVLNYTGSLRRANSLEQFGEYDIILSSYGVILRDHAILSQFPFHYIILDESQKIKNPVSKSARVLRKFKAAHRLCLSGTPVENNLMELWSQIAFLNPGMLGSMQKFQSEFVKPVTRDNDISERIEFLKQVIYPVILRRTKEVVAKELPPRTEIIHYCEMSPEQEKMYHIVRQAVMKEVMEEIDKKGIRSSGIKIIEALLRLRQICNHPVIMHKDYRGASGKFEEFKEMLPEVLEEGHKVLIFSQFVSMLELMKEHLDAENIQYVYLTGQTKDRQSLIEQFQSDRKTKVFLISLKAGGFGLNLTAADIVMLYDPWWNPAVERQAADRTHRIGQEKNIFIYKFITRGTVEEKILELQDRKRRLVEQVLAAEHGLFKTLTRQDIEHLFS